MSFLFHIDQDAREILYGDALLAVEVGFTDSETQRHLPHFLASEELHLKDIV